MMGFTSVEDGFTSKQPIAMLLWCPQCHQRHIDEGEFATKPHRVHACQHCGATWQPALQETVGVQFLWNPIEGPGKPLPASYPVETPKCPEIKVWDKVEDPRHAAERWHTPVDPLATCYGFAPPVVGKIQDIERGLSYADWCGRFHDCVPEQQRKAHPDYTLVRHEFWVDYLQRHGLRPKDLDDRGPDRKSLTGMKEKVHDAEISPLMTQVIAICQRHGIGMIADFEINDLGAKQKACSTAVPPDSEQSLRHKRAMAHLLHGSDRTTERNEGPK